MAWKIGRSSTATGLNLYDDEHLIDVTNPDASLDLESARLILRLRSRYDALALATKYAMQSRGGSFCYETWCDLLEEGGIEVHNGIYRGIKDL